MVVDSSALIAILNEEPETEAFIRLLSSSPCALLSCATYVEMSIILQSRYHEGGTAALDRLISTYNIALVPFTAAQASLASLAFQKYGKGCHKTGLNFGDCMAYALAKDTGEPLLYKGNDFSFTDIQKAA